MSSEISNQVRIDKDTHLVTLSSRSIPLGPLHLVILLLTYSIIGALYATQTPRWQVPDEPAHYNYTRHLVTQHAFPVLEPGDYDQAYLSELTSTGFPPDKPIDKLEYEDHQPPLYYLLATPIFVAFGGALLPLRLFSLLLGAGVIVFAWLVVREIFPEHEILTLTTAGFVAFVPQHIAMMAGVNNDSLAELLIGLGLWITIKAFKSPSLGFGIWDLGFWFLGFVLGLSFITKTTVYPLAVIIGLMLLIKAKRDAWNARQLLITGLKIFLPALVLGALWWGRDIAVYGGTDILGLQRHNAVVVGQPRTSEWLATYGAAEVARRFFVTTFQSFWGQFGWMGVVMDQRVYLALVFYLVGLVIGGGIALFRRPALTGFQRDGLILLLISGLLTLGLYLYYNLSFVQHQGRYLFPALIPIGLAAATSLQAWGKLAENIVRFKIGWLVPLGALVAMAALDVFALYRFIIPALSHYG